MPSDAAGGQEQSHDDDEYVFLPIDAAGVVVRWRVRLTFAVLPVGVLIVQDISPVAVYLLGAATVLSVMVVGSWLGNADVRVRRAKARRSTR